MSKHWSLPEELYRALHQWPLILAFCLVGALLGWAVARVWPSSYRATANLYVALNPYRAYEDSNFVANANPKYSNLDDYKNWQMAQLQSVIFQDEMIEETLEKLESKGEFWLKADSDKLRDMLSTQWRSPGTWGLVAEGNDRKNTKQAANVWSQVVLTHVNAAVSAAREAILVDEELQALTAELVQLRLQRIGEDHPGKDDDLDRRIEALEMERDRLADLYSQLVDSSLGLSPNIEIEPLEFIPSQVVRPTSLMILIGGMSGLLLWAFLLVVRITVQVRIIEETEVDSLDR